jgi:hypothetical protein
MEVCLVGFLLRAVLSAPVFHPAAHAFAETRNFLVSCLVPLTLILFIYNSNPCAILGETGKIFFSNYYS